MTAPAKPCVAAYRAAAIAALLLTGFGAGRAGAAEAPSACEVTRIIGQPVMVRAGERIPLSPNIVLYAEDQVVTGAGAKVEIRCEDGSVIVVGDRSRVALTAFVTPPARRGWTGVLSMIEGILRVTLPGTKRWDRLETVTDTAVASARSTAWIVDAKKDTTGVLALEGSVNVAGRTAGGEVTLTPGQGTDVARGARPTAPKTWGLPRANAARARTALP
ncbi:MAG: FecR domain-containing protein [Candidatus Eiseniibacteriota bacterium]